MKNSKTVSHSIAITNPCLENWNEMKAEEQGRFCLKCAKTVIDFTQKSKEQIKSYFEEVSGKVCGRFRNEQLVLEPVKPSVNLYKMRVFACALYLVFGSILFSCSNEKVSKKEIHETTGVVMNLPTVGEVESVSIIVDGNDRELVNMINEIGAENERRVREEQNGREGFVVGFLAPIIIEEEVLFEDIKPTCVKESPFPDTNSQDPDQINGLPKIKMR